MLSRLLGGGFLFPKKPLPPSHFLGVSELLKIWTKRKQLRTLRLNPPTLPPTIPYAPTPGVLSLGSSPHPTPGAIQPPPFRVKTLWDAPFDKAPRNKILQGVDPMSSKYLHSFFNMRYYDYYYDCWLLVSWFLVY